MGTSVFRVPLQIISVFTLTHPKTFYTGLCKCMWHIFTLALCKCKTFGRVSGNDLHLHYIYTLYIRLLTLTHTTLVWTFKLVLCWYLIFHKILMVGSLRYYFKTMAITKTIFVLVIRFLTFQKLYEQCFTKQLCPFSKEMMFSCDSYKLKSFSRFRVGFQI